MIVGYHVIFGAYGFWLPNDPRGSWSDFVGSWELFRYGQATKTNETHSVARRPHDIRRRLDAKESLKYPPCSSPACRPGPSDGGLATTSGSPAWSSGRVP